MKPIHTKLSKILVLALILSLSHAQSTTSATTSTSTVTPDVAQTAQASSTVVPNRYIITCASSGLSSTATSQISSLQGTIVTNLDGAGIVVITSDHPDFATQAAKIAGVTSVVNDRQRKLDPTWVKSAVSFESIDEINENPPLSDNQNPLFNLQWGLGAIHVPEAWETGARGKGARVAVLDTGFDLNHPDLKANIDLKRSKSFVPNEGLQWIGGPAGFSHGTYTAGLIAGVDNKVGIVGVAPEAKLMLVKVISDALDFGLDSWVLAGIKYAVDQGADVINLSLGGYSDINDPIVKTFKKILNYAYKRGTTVVASAGNESFDLDLVNELGFIELPGQGPHVLLVSAAAPIGWANYPLTTDFDNIASYTNYGSPIFLAAPGGDTKYAGPTTDIATIAGRTRPVFVFDFVFSSTNGGYIWATGTSASAPHVSGVAALIIGKAGGKASPDFVRRTLKSSSDDLGYPGKDIFYGYGRVNAYKAIKSMSC